MGKWILNSGKTVAKDFPTINIINAIGFTVSFFVLRILGFTHIGWWTLWENRDTLNASPMHFQISCHVCFGLGLSMQFYWFDKIIKGLYQLITGKKGQKKGV